MTELELIDRERRIMVEGIGKIPQCDRATKDGRTYPAERKHIPIQYIWLK